MARRAPACKSGTVADVRISMSSPAMRTAPAFATRHAFHRTAVAHAAALPSRICCEKPAPSGRRVVAGRLTTAASSNETCCHGSAPNRRPSTTGADDIPSPTDGPAPIAKTGRGPRRLAQARRPGARRRLPASAAVRGTRRLRDGRGVRSFGPADALRRRLAVRRERLPFPLPGAESAPRARSPSPAPGGGSRCSPTGTPARRPTCRSNRATRCVRRWRGRRRLDAHQHVLGRAFD